MSDMKTLSVREAQHGFAGMLNMVAKGEDVQITRRRHVVARLVPPARQTTKAKWPDIMARLRKDFGDKLTPDSSSIFEDMRGER
jgi:antitoxin (DNA-binding transcriptional repressor) of toxin-antitoxin stability system